MGFMDGQLDKLRDIEVSDDKWAIIDRYQGGTRENFSLVIERYRLLSAEPVEELPTNYGQEALSRVEALGRLVDELYNTPATDPNIHNVTQRFAQYVTEAWNWWRNTGRTWVRAADAIALAQAGDIDAELQAARAARVEAEGIAEKLRTVAVKAGSLALAQHYEDNRKEHRDVARKALTAVIVLSVVLVVGGFMILWTIPNTDQWTVLARDALARAFALGALSYGVAFSTRIYRTNTHMAAVYEQKASALNTFSLFVSASENADSRALITGELVRAVFASADTGVFQKDSDRTVVESVIPVATAMAQR